MIPNIPMNHLRAFAPLLLCLAASAHAHQIWIEQPVGGNAVVRFGEFGENLREASPGLLDKFGKPTATLVTARGEQSVDARKTSSGFALPFKAGKGDALVAEDAAYPLYDFKKGEQAQKGWYLPAARLVTGDEAVPPKLALDMVPTGKAGEFRLFFKGQPLPKAKVAMVTQSGWAREGHSDAQGLVNFDLPWRGTYVAEVSHTDTTAGERRGPGGAEKYDKVDYVTSLTVMKANGVSPIAAGKAATPNP
jgi:uncharacterized GH25 family protein